MAAVTPWMRLDTNFWHDPKFVLLMSNKGQGAAFQALQIFCLVTAEEGKIDLTDPLKKAWVEAEMCIMGKRLDNLLKTLADHELIDGEKLERGIVTSKRLTEEAFKSKDYKRQRSEASKKRWEKERENDASE